VWPASGRTLGCAATRRSPALTGLRVDGSSVSPSPGTSSDAPGRGADPVPGNPARSESASGTWWRGIRSPTALPGWERARSRHQAHRIIEAGPGASSAAAARWPAPGARASRARTRLVVSGKRPKPKFRGSFPAGCIATPAAQQASAKCSSAADTPPAASGRRIVARRCTARRGPARRSGTRRSEPQRHIVPRRTTRGISRKHHVRNLTDP
jgi:hypothetical protein